MASIETPCAHCGWRNEPGARMCGGCGRPLTLTSAKSGVVAPDEAITDPDLQPVGRGRRAATPVAAPPLPAPRRGNTFGRVLLILGVIVLIFACICAGAWGLIIRPALHRQADTALRAQLTTMTDQATAALKDLAPLIKTQPGGNYPGVVSAAQVTQDLQANTPAQSQVSNVTVNFADGLLKLDFDTNGSHNEITTILATSSGRLVARGTTITGIIAIFENGSELESAVNDALARLPDNPQFSNVTLADGKLSFVLTAKS